ncbi:MAG: hypothetical protein ABIZ18_07685 [Caldimonas sp.]
MTNQILSQDEVDALLQGIASDDDAPSSEAVDAKVAGVNVLAWRATTASRTGSTP